MLAVAALLSFASPCLAEAPAGAPVANEPTLASDAILATVLAASDAPGRRQALTDALASGRLDGETAALVGQAMAVVGYLDSTHRSDPSIVRLFLTAAFSSDPAIRAAAVDAAKAGGDPPLAAAATPTSPPAVAVAAPAAPDPTVLRKYNSQHLVRGALDLTVGSVYGTHGNTYGSVSTVSTWTVRDGAGAPLKTIQFADVVGDTSGAERFRSRRTTGSVLAYGGLGIGSVLLLTSTGFLLGDDTSPNRDRQLKTAGGLLVASCVLYVPGFVGLIMLQKLGLISRNYTPAEADQSIEKYNGHLRTELGLSEQAVQAIDTK